MLRLELHGKAFMRRTMVGLTILIIICAGVRSAMAGDKIDVPKVITKSDAEKILGVPVKDAKGHNQPGSGGYYESERRYPDHDWNSRSSRRRGSRFGKIDGHKNSCQPVTTLVLCCSSELINKSSNGILRAFSHLSPWRKGRGLR